MPFLQGMRKTFSIIITYTRQLGNNCAIDAIFD